MKLQQARFQAIGMARQCNSELFAISVTDMLVEPLANAPALEERMEKEARGLLERVKAKVEKGQIPCETITRIGGIPMSISLERRGRKTLISLSWEPAARRDSRTS